ncbi:MAG: ComEC/Rec2 family competence protein [Gordonia sp. (in: high G+C Gram-positive bacteria)]|uniref:ComEC/Rec2 family competence protein n=1 Tax=Gordonia sp. (in: high G+C Gram-positive bacteria) TaxID=84139 RepID=UPI003C76E5B6
MNTSDLRLALPAAGCWAASAAALAAPIAVNVALAGVLAVVGCAVAAWGWRESESKREWAVTIAAACGVTAASAVAVTLRIVAVDAAPIRAAEGKPVVELEVTGDPKYLPHSQMLLPVKIRTLSGRNQRPVAAQLAATAGPVDPLPGERYRVRVRARPPKPGPSNRLSAARLSAVGELRLVRGPPWWQSVAGRVRERLRDISALSLPERAAGLLPGLVLGDTSGLDQETSDNFRAAGLSHLVAVSGSNFALVCGAVILGIRMTGASAKTVVVLGAFTIVGFVILVRPTDSVLRAAVMGSVGLAAGLGSRRAQALPALGTAVIIVVLLWPQMALSPGFALSVAATLGLVLWAVPIRRALVRRGLPEWLATLAAMTLAAQILTTPLLVLITDTVNVLAVPANLLAVPVVGMAGLLGTAAAVIGALGPRYGPGGVLAEFLIRAAGPPTRWLIVVADWLGAPGWASITIPAWFGFVLILVTGACWGIWHVRRVAGDDRPVVPVWHHGKGE